MVGVGSMTDQSKAQKAAQARSELKLTNETIAMMRREALDELERVDIEPNEAYAMSANLRALRAIERRLNGIIQDNDLNKKLLAAREGEA